MKRFLFCLLCLAGSLPLLHAQSEVPADTTSLPSTPKDTPLLPENVKTYGGFLLDMNLMNLHMPERPNLDNYKLVVPDASKDYSYLFRPQTDAIYTQGNYSLFSPYYGGFGTGNFWGTPSTLQMGSFRLNNGWRLNTYGEYNADGWHVPNPSALPWERNNFKGAFELKSDNGFGIRIEVQHGRETPFY